VPTEALQGIEFGDEPTIRRMSGEQSNSSLVIGDKAVLKVIRRLASGVHPETEMGRYLTSAGFANTPATLGEATRFSADGVQYTMLVLQQFIDNQGDAWQWTLDTLARVIQQQTTPEGEATSDMAAEMSNPQEDLERLIVMLGRRLGEMHVLLSSPTDNPAFSLEHASEEDVHAWTNAAHKQLDAALDILRGISEWSNDDEARRMTWLVEQREHLARKMEALCMHAVNSPKFRIHGDFHLGQVLVAHGDVYLVDFEGEPVKSLEERRQKASPLRDVAGLLRSIDYAAAFSRNASLGDLSEAAELRKQKILRDFPPQAQSTFLQAYQQAVAGTTAALDAQAEQALLNLFVLEKAAYEVCYEAANRPSWIAVPANGLAKIADALLNLPEGD
jgi:maltose alpha-D-glucosyltransferase/alpha-amylase